MTFPVFVNLSLSQTFWNPLELMLLCTDWSRKISKLPWFSFSLVFVFVLSAQNIHLNHFSCAKDAVYIITFKYFGISLVKHSWGLKPVPAYMCAAPAVWGHGAAAATQISPGRGGGSTGWDVLVLLQGTFICQSLWFHLCKRLKVVCTLGLWSDPHWQFDFALASKGKQVNSWWTYWQVDCYCSLWAVLHS